MIEEKELLAFDKELFIFSTMKEMEREKENDKNKVIAAINHLKCIGSKIILTVPEVENLYEDEFAYRHMTICFQKDSKNYWLTRHTSNRKYTYFDESKFLASLHDLIMQKLITDIQFNLFLNSYYFFLKSFKDEDLLKFVPPQYMLYYWIIDKINFSEENKNCIQNILFDSPLDIVSSEPLDKFSNIGIYKNFIFFDTKINFQLRIENIIDETCKTTEINSNVLSKAILHLEDFMNK